VHVEVVKEGNKILKVSLRTESEIEQKPIANPEISKSEIEHPRAVNVSVPRQMATKCSIYNFGISDLQWAFVQF
jgi:hypothetical protein